MPEPQVSSTLSNIACLAATSPQTAVLPLSGHTDDRQLLLHCCYAVETSLYHSMLCISVPSALLPYAALCLTHLVCAYLMLVHASRPHESLQS